MTETSPPSPTICGMFDDPEPALACRLVLDALVESPPVVGSNEVGKRPIVFIPVVVAKDVGTVAIAVVGTVVPPVVASCEGRKIGLDFELFAENVKPMGNVVESPPTAGGGRIELVTAPPPQLGRLPPSVDGCLINNWDSNGAERPTSLEVPLLLLLPLPVLGSKPAEDIGKAVEGRLLVVDPGPWIVLLVVSLKLGTREGRKTTAADDDDDDDGGAPAAAVDDTKAVSE